MGQSLRAAASEVGEVGLVLDHARHHFEIADAARERIGHRLEDVRRHWLVVRHLALDGLAAFVVQAFHFAAIERRRKVVNHKIQQRLTPDVGQTGADDDRIEPLFRERLLDPRHQVFYRDRSLVEEFLHQLIVAFGHHLDQRLVRLGCRVRQLGRDVRFFSLTRPVRLVRRRLHADQVDDAAKAFLLA